MKLKNINVRPHLCKIDSDKLDLIDTIKENGAVLFPEDQMNEVYENGELTLVSSNLHLILETSTSKNYLESVCNRTKLPKQASLDFQCF